MTGNFDAGSNVRSSLTGMSGYQSNVKPSKTSDTATEPEGTKIAKDTKTGSFSIKPNSSSNDQTYDPSGYNKEFDINNAQQYNKK